VLEELLGVGLLTRRLRQHEAVDRRLHRVGADGGVDRGEGEEVEVVAVGVGDLLADEHAEQVHGALLLRQRLGGLLPGPAE
jgi:hypothetical protein